MTYLDKIAVRLRLVLTQPINTSAVIIMALYTLLWGLFIMAPWFSVFDQAQLYSALISIAPEYVWGTIAFVTGSFMLYGVIRHSYRSLTNGAFAGVIHWLIICTGYFLGDWQNTGWLTCLMIAVYCAFVWLNLKINKDEFPFHSERRPVD